MSGALAPKVPTLGWAPQSPNAVMAWPDIAARAPKLVATMAHYLDQIAVSSRPRFWCPTACRLWARRGMLVYVVTN
jgi:hypothetical protein